MKKVEEIDGEHTILVDIHFAPTLQLPSGLVSSQGNCFEIHLVYQDPDSSPVEKNEHVCMLHDILAALALRGCDTNILLTSCCCCACCCLHCMFHALWSMLMSRSVSPHISLGPNATWQGKDLFTPSLFNIACVTLLDLVKFRRSKHHKGK